MYGADIISDNVYGGAVPANRAAKEWLKKVAPIALQRTLPLWARMQLVVWAGQRGFRWHFPIPRDLLRDLAETKPNAFHHFLWSHHLAYAAGYEVSRFGPDKLEPSRRMLFDDMGRYLRTRGIVPEQDVTSVFDVGCSVGHVLRYAETEVFRSATRLRGVDVDRYAIESGRKYLQHAGSRIDLSVGDAFHAEEWLNGQSYDVGLCCGVLMYFDQATAARVVQTVVAHSKLVAGFICLAHPEVENSCLAGSTIRAIDRAFSHNLHAMVKEAGARVVSHRWIPQPLAPGTSPPYVVVAAPQ